MICERCKNPTLEYTTPRCDQCGADPLVELEFAAFHKPAIIAVRRLIFAIGIAYPLTVLAAFGYIAYSDYTIDPLMTPDFYRASCIAFALFIVHIGLFTLAKRSPIPAAIVSSGLYLVHIVTLYVWGYAMTEALFAEIAIVACLIAGLVASVRAERLRFQVVTNLRELRAT